MTEPHGLEVADALDNLVRQFADPLAFFRELIQNALDAGTNEVEVWTDFKPSSDDPDTGLMTLAVDDFGEGMDRKTIDSRLTRLFSSAKDKDFTKIGKFGIGFVSVFALQPDAVVVDTSRGGENWRVIFRADRSFVRVERDTPVDGTKVQLIKQVTRAEYDDLAARSRRTVAFWCRHVETPILFDGEPINAPFDIPDAVCSARAEADGIEAIVGYRPGLQPSFGFYNKGLTLMEGDGDEFFPEVAFKLSSRYLEHTLTRDNLIRDKHFDKAMAVVRKLVDTGLDDALWATLSEVHQDPPRLDAWISVVVQRLRAGRKPPKGALDHELTTDLRGTSRTLQQLADTLRAGKLWLAERRTPLVDALVERGHVVVGRNALSASLQGLLRMLADNASLFTVEAAWMMPQGPRSDDEAARWQPLQQAAAGLFEAQGLKHAAIELAHLDASLANRVYVVQETFGEPSRRNQDAIRKVGDWRRRDTIVVNANHEAVVPLLRLARTEPELAAFTLAKLACLDGGGITVELDGQLSAAATRVRLRRLESRP